MAKILHSIEEGALQGSLGIDDWPAGCGAECVFVGRTREQTHQTLGQLIRLEYEIHRPMARKLLGDIGLDAVKKWGCQYVEIRHAAGAVSPGEASVMIAVATPHRAEAFAACRYLIDRVKHELPIWKREIWERGETFVEGCCVDPFHHHALAGEAPTSGQE